MKCDKHLTVARWLAACTALSVLSPAQAAPPAYDGQWHFTLTPYLWLPTVNGRLNYSLPPGQGGSTENELGPNDYLENLQFILLLGAEARRDEWAVIADLIYLDFGKDDSRVNSVGGRGSAISIPRERNVGTQTDLKGWAWMLAGSYTAWRSETASVDLLAGVRQLHLQTGLDWSLDSTLAGPGFTFERSGSVKRDITLTDGIIGMHGRVWFGNGKWFVPYYLDVGTGDSSLTWQALAGVGYAYSWGDVQLSWRHLSYDQSDDKFVQNLRFSGPALGVSWRF